MLDNIINDVKLIEAVMLHYLYFTGGIIGLLIIIHLINKLLKYKLSYLGIIPRHTIGLPGIIFSPFLHGNTNHLFFNSIPLFFLMNMVLVSSYNVFIAVSFTIILLSGALTWLLGRHAIHIGASSVIMGYFGFLSIHAYADPNFLSVVLIVCCLYYFGGLVAALIPINSQGISVEGHIFGFISGITAYYLLPFTLSLV